MIWTKQPLLQGELKGLKLLLGWLTTAATCPAPLSPSPTYPCPVRRVPSTPACAKHDVVVCGGEQPGPLSVSRLPLF